MTNHEKLLHEPIEENVRCAACLTTHARAMDNGGTLFGQQTGVERAAAAFGYAFAALLSTSIFVLACLLAVWAGVVVARRL